ncbi:MAG: FeoB-associated Cys-rich membrane protein [Clostridiales bacterium]|nr:FeoB-associated Cys-rich membrane protein [Clostridiales bacterium]
MGRFITILILIVAVAFVGLMIYSKVKEIRGKNCSGCSGCENRESCSAQQKLDCPEYEQEKEKEKEKKNDM